MSVIWKVGQSVGRTVGCTVRHSLKPPIKVVYGVHVLKSRPEKVFYSLKAVKSGQTANLRLKSVSSKLDLAHSRCDISHSEA